MCRAESAASSCGGWSPQVGKSTTGLFILRKRDLRLDGVGKAGKGVIKEKVKVKVEVEGKQFRVRVKTKIKVKVQVINSRFRSREAGEGRGRREVEAR